MHEWDSHIGREDHHADDGSDHLFLSCGYTAIALDKARVREIRRWTQPTPLPGAVAGRIGAINLRGTIIPVFDLALKAGSARLPITGRSIIVVAEVQSRLVGILADQVTTGLTDPDADGNTKPSAPELFDPATLMPGAAPPIALTDSRCQTEGEK